MAASDGSRIIQGECLEVLRTLPSESVHCCVTSPPYWGLRDYGTASWEGGSAECDHKAPDDSGQSTKQSSAQRKHAGRFRGDCHKCGARRMDRQIGLESTPEEYAMAIVAVFAEVRRVLRSDGTLWLNLGDTYNGYIGNQRTTSISARNQESRPLFDRCYGLRSDGLKNKDLVGIPWLVAFALRADGWYLRQDIIWHKPTHMPESVTDRCTKAHEYIFLLSKSARYYYNAAAIAEPATHAGRTVFLGEKSLSRGQATGMNRPASGNGNAESVEVGTDRNKRSVWTVATKPYKEAHFATFPPDLIQPCILAGCPEGGTVLDPFLGSGTTALVAMRNGCQYIGIELNPQYVKLAKKRVRQKSLLT